MQTLTFKTVVHQVTICDCQPLPDGGILVQCMGQLKADEDPPHSFAETFILRQDQAGSWYIAHEIFRLVLHNG